MQPLLTMQPFLRFGPVKQISDQPGLITVESEIQENSAISFGNSDTTFVRVADGMALAAPWFAQQDQAWCLCDRFKRRDFRIQEFGVLTVRVGQKPSIGQVDRKRQSKPPVQAALCGDEVGA
jgi:hypothetical protein